MDDFHRTEFFFCFFEKHRTEFITVQEFLGKQMTCIIVFVEMLIRHAPGLVFRSFSIQAKKTINKLINY